MFLIFFCWEHFFNGLNKLIKITVVYSKFLYSFKTLHKLINYYQTKISLREGFFSRETPKPA
jgi:hypothetical protein